MCFSLSLCILLIALNQKPTWTFFATDMRWKLQKKRLSHAISGTFWETSAEPFFSQRYLDSPTPSPAMAVLAVDTNKRLSFGWKAHWVVLFSSPCLTQLFCRWQEQDVIWRQQLEPWEMREGGCGALLSLPEQGSSQMNGAGRGDEGKRKGSPRQFTWRNRITRRMIDKLVALCTLF